MVLYTSEFVRLLIKKSIHIVYLFPVDHYYLNKFQISRALNIQ